MSALIEAHARTIVELFSETDQYFFSIPDYQRPYSWRKEEAGVLFDDLFDAFSESKTAGGLKDGYFLGSMVIVKPVKGKPDSDVIDGQQRLTTLTILLAAIRYAIKEARYKEQVTRMICYESDGFESQQNGFRLTLREADKVFFQKNIQEPEGIIRLVKENDSKLADSQERIRENAKLFFEKLRQNKLSGDERLCVEFLSFIRKECFLVVVSTPELDSAYRIFSSLNSRGLELSHADILKSNIIGKIESSNRGKYNATWETIEKGLGRENFSDLFSHIRMMHIKHKPKQSLLKDFALEIKPDKTAASAKKFIDERLAQLADFYKSFLETKSFIIGSRKADLASSLFWLERLEFKDWVPPALTFAIKFRAEADVQAFFKKLECLAYFMSVTRSSVNFRIERFSKITELVDKAKSFKDLEGVGSPLLLTVAEKKEFYSFLAGPVYESLPAKPRLNILLKLDSLSSERVASYDYSRVSIEHVLPQVAKASDWPGFDKANREYWTHRLANLVLLSRSRNSLASNFPFDKKKEAYIGSSFALTMELGTVKQWNPKALEERQAKILGRLKEDWGLS